MLMTAPAADSAQRPAGTGRFAFGANWRGFLSVVDERRIHEAQDSLRQMLGGDLAGVAWLDIGSGSGLFSVAAARLGASRIHSFDFDPISVACTQELRRRHRPPRCDWTVQRGDVLDGAYMRSLGRFDVVYAWGVLHHTGDMWTGLDNAAGAVDDGGRLFVAIYNDQGARSRAWRAVKRRYNALPSAARLPYVLLVMAPRELLSAAMSAARGRPLQYVRGWTNYTSMRGMSRWHDLVDWVGGYPFEVATPEQVLDALRPHGFELERMTTCGGGLGCNQFVFRRAAGA